MEDIEKYITSPKFWVSLIVIISAVLIYLIIKKFVVRHLKREDVTGRKETNIRVTFTIVRYVLVIFIAITVLQINGVNVTSLIAGLGIASVIVGFALQDILKDLIMGSNIVWDQFFFMGDVVRYKDIEGTVVYFNIKVTKIYDVHTGNTFTISNRNISEIEKVSDWLDIIVPASYDESAERMRGICADICGRIAGLKDVTACEFLGTDDFADSQINYRIRLHCPPELKAPVRRTALGIIQDVFAENGISIPYPQLDIHGGAFPFISHTNEKG